MLYWQIHFNQIKSKMAVYNMNNVHVSPDVLSTLLLLQQGNLYKLQQKIMHDISRSSRPELICKKAGLKNYAEFIGKYLCRSLFLIKLQAFRSATLLKRNSSTGVFCDFAKFLRTSILKNIYETICRFKVYLRE